MTGWFPGNESSPRRGWIPAFAGTTEVEGFGLTFGIQALPLTTLGHHALRPAS